MNVPLLKNDILPNKSITIYMVKKDVSIASNEAEAEKVQARVVKRLSVQTTIISTITIKLYR
jgi:hypothetical protein